MRIEWEDEGDKYYADVDDSITRDWRHLSVTHIDGQYAMLTLSDNTSRRIDIPLIGTRVHDECEFTALSFRGIPLEALEGGFRFTEGADVLAKIDEIVNYELRTTGEVPCSIAIAPSEWNKVANAIKSQFPNMLTEINRRLWADESGTIEPNVFKGLEAWLPGGESIFGTPCRDAHRFSDDYDPCPHWYSQAKETLEGVQHDLCSEIANTEWKDLEMKNKTQAALDRVTEALVYLEERTESERD